MSNLLLILVELECHVGIPNGSYLFMYVLCQLNHQLFVGSFKMNSNKSHSVSGLVLPPSCVGFALVITGIQ